MNVSSLIHLDALCAHSTWFEKICLIQVGVGLESSILHKFTELNFIGEVESEVLLPSASTQFEGLGVERIKGRLNSFEG